MSEPSQEPFRLREAHPIRILGAVIGDSDNHFRQRIGEAIFHGEQRLHKNRIYSVHDLIVQETPRPLLELPTIGPRHVGFVHDFLAEENLTPKWEAPARRTVIHKPYVSLLARVIPESSIAKFCELLDETPAHGWSPQSKKKEIPQLHKALRKEGCTTLKTLLEMPVGEIMNLDISSHMQKVLFEYIQRFNKQFQNQR
jgi:hypothetical protein